MKTSLRYSLFDVTYPDSDGLPMAESDATRDYLIYGVEKFVREALRTQNFAIA